ncbi:MAG: hypothetical protein HUU38_01100, partial [Anaerolineales bacterium]|nr:hypothetical protein [Anaerolineales bacterium]
IIIIAHFFAPPEYVWTQNTISDLAAQGVEHQWLMQVGFIGFGENGLIPLGKGLVQRTLYLVSFVWLASPTRLSASSAPDHPQMGMLKRIGEL